MPQLLGQKRNLRPTSCDAASTVEPTSIPPKSTTLGNQDENSAFSGQRHCSGHHRLAPRLQLQNYSTTVQSRPSNRSPTKTLSARPKYTPAKSSGTSKQCKMLTVPRAGTTAKPMLPPSPTGTPSSLRYSSTNSKDNGNSEMKHFTGATTPKTLNSLSYHTRLCAKANRLHVQGETLLALVRPILLLLLTAIRDLPTAGLEAWVSQAESTIFRC